MTTAPVRPQQVTTGPIQGSAKAWIDGPDGITVPVRRIALSTGEHHDVYDTSGPYTDAHAVIDLHAGLPRLREPWVSSREPGTQMSWARAGVVTPRWPTSPSARGATRSSSAPRSPAAGP